MLVQTCLTEVPRTRIPRTRLRMTGTEFEREGEVAPNTCAICRQPAERRWLNPLTIVETRCRRCGHYQMSHAFDEDLEASRARSVENGDTELERLLPYLSAHTRQNPGPVVLTTSIDWRTLAQQHMTTSVATKVSRILQYIARQSATPGAWVPFDEANVGPLFDVGTTQELDYLTKHLVDLGAVDPQETFGPTRFRLTVRGWEMAAPIGGGGVPGTCFVAMAFHESLNGTYDGAIKPAVQASGLDDVRVDRIEHNGVITDVIIAEIRRAQVVIADVTLQRQGVYFEAGFALGLGRTVIWSCRSDEIERVHFDTRQYNHVVWTDDADLRIKLEARIRATVQVSE